MLKINKVVRNFLSIAFSNIISQIIMFFLVAFYARVLGKEVFGNINTVQAIIMYFTMITLLGLQTYGSREIAKDKNNTSKIVGEILILRLLVSVICFLMVVLISSFITKDFNFKVLLLLYGITLIPIALNIDWVFIGLQEMQYNSIYNIIKTVIPFGLIIGFIKNSQDSLLIPIFLLIGLVVGMCYQIYIYIFKKRFKISFKLNRKIIKNNIYYGFPFLISGILAMVNSNADRIIIKFARSSAEAGIYSSGYNIIYFLTNIITIVFTTVFPLLIGYYNTKRFDLLNKLCSSLARVIVLVSLPLCVGGILLSKEIIIFIFGKEYITGNVSFSLLMIYILLLFRREIYGYNLNAWNMEKKYLKIVAISSIVNLVLNLILTPLYGMNVAASITVLSEVINLTQMKRQCDSVVKINYSSFFYKALIPTIIMSVCILIFKYFNIPVILNILSASIVYFIFIFLLKYITFSEFKNLLTRKEF